MGKYKNSSIPTLGPLHVLFPLSGVSFLQTTA